MKSCIRVPRVFLPRENFENWAVVACDRFAHDPSYWERVARKVSDAPSVLSCILPDEFTEDDEEIRIKQIRENMFEHLESGVLERLNRGMILVARSTSSGVRRGILANIDLEEFSPLGEKSAVIRASTDTIPSLVERRLHVRRASVLEFPHTVLLYRDKKDKIFRSLDDDLELLYEIELLERGGKISAYFIPDVDAEYLAHDLMGHADPCFVVADGNHSLAGAKAHWEEIKKTISASEARNHPARFMLVEFVNGLDDAVSFHPVHRLIKEIEPEVFCDFYSRKIKCKREGNLLFPLLSDAESYQKSEAVIRDYLKQNYGKVEYRTERPSELLQADDCAVVALPAVEKQELFAAAKSGERYPAKTFQLGGEEDARYSFEGREISYD